MQKTSKAQSEMAFLFLFYSDLETIQGSSKRFRTSVESQVPFANSCVSHLRLLISPADCAGLVPESDETRRRVIWRHAFCGDAENWAQPEWRNDRTEATEREYRFP